MTKEGFCTNQRCSYLRRYGKPLWTRLRYHHNKEQVCESCFERFVFESRRANQHRPTFAEMTAVLAEALAPLASRITTLELENAALRQALETQVPLTRTKTEVARAMMLAGASRLVCQPDLVEPAATPDFRRPADPPKPSGVSRRRGNPVCALWDTTKSWRGAWSVGADEKVK